MNIGKLDRLIELEVADTTRNAHGERLDAWRSEGKVWAAVQYDNGNEAFDNAQKQAVQRVQFLIRYRAGGLTSRFRVKFEGKPFDIEAVTEIGRRNGLKLIAYSRS